MPVEIYLPEECQIQVHKNKVKLFRQEKLKEGRVKWVRENELQLKDFVGQLNKEQSRRKKAMYSSEFLPTGTRAFKDFGKKKILVLEHPPAMRTIHIDFRGASLFHDMHQEGGDFTDGEDWLAQRRCRREGEEWTDKEGNPLKSTFLLALPYIVYILYLESEGDLSGPWSIPCYKSRMFFRNGPLTSLDDLVYLSAMPHARGIEGGRDEDGDVIVPQRGQHMDASGRFGLGAVCVDPQLETFGINAAVEEALDFYWSTVFSFIWGLGKQTMWGSQYYEVAEREPRMSTLYNWEENSRLNPSFILSVDWVEVGKLSEMIKEVERGCISTPKRERVGGMQVIMLENIMAGK